MSTEPGKPATPTPKGALDVSDLPPELQRVALNARAAENASEMFDAEKERRDRSIVEAKNAGYTYQQIQGALRRGDGHATISMVYNAMVDYA